MLKYRDEFQCITKSAVGDTLAVCNLCRCDVKHRTQRACQCHLRKHFATQKHLNAASAVSFNRQFADADRSVEVTHSELLFASF